MHNLTCEKKEGKERRKADYEELAAVFGLRGRHAKIFGWAKSAAICDLHATTLGLGTKEIIL